MLVSMHALLLASVCCCMEDHVWVQVSHQVPCNSKYDELSQLELKAKQAILNGRLGPVSDSLQGLGLRMDISSHAY